MENTLLTAGIASVIASVVGGGLKAFNIEIPLLETSLRKVLLFIVGLVFICGSLIISASRTESSRSPSGAATAEIVGRIATDMSRNPTSAGESHLGNLVADAHLFVTSVSADPQRAAQIAFVNSGALRADLSLGPSGTGEITTEDLFAVYPFSSVLVTMTLTGAQIDALLEQQWLGQPIDRVLQVSRGFTYTWDARAAPGSRVDPATIRVAGTQIELNRSYRVTVNDFLADGGDNFTVLREGTDRVVGQIDALATYFRANRVVARPPLGRINRIN